MQQNKISISRINFKNQLQKSTSKINFKNQFQLQKSTSKVNFKSQFQFQAFKKSAKISIIRFI